MGIFPNTGKENHCTVMYSSVPHGMILLSTAQYCTVHNYMISLAISSTDLTACV